MTVCKVVLHFVVILGMSMFWTWAVWPQTPGTESPMAMHPPSLIDTEAKWLVAQFGFAGMLLLVGIYVWKRLAPMEELVTRYEAAVARYDATQQAHLAAFKDINERNMGTFRETMAAMQKVSEDSQSTAILCAQVNTKVAERLDYLGKERAG